MQYPEEELISILQDSGVDFTSSLPCEKIGLLLEMVEATFFHVPLTREEEGVGLSAGAALAGRRPAMFIQSSGVGNMINALLSLTRFYELPLAVFVSHRGIYKEKIKAQVPMGQRLSGILKGAGIPCSAIRRSVDLEQIEKRLPGVYRNNRIHVFFLSPEVWEKSKVRTKIGERRIEKQRHNITEIRTRSVEHYTSSPRLSRYEILETIAPYLKSKVVICNLGWPSKELFAIKDQPSNFYMLGSMGMATPIGLGVAVSSPKEVIVIDGDGSILMNPGSLAIAAHLSPDNLTICAIDNGTYGSTGDQPTLASSCVDLEAVAKGFGINSTYKISRKKRIGELMKRTQRRLTFLHVLAIPGNADVPNISLDHLENKKLVQESIRKGDEVY